jgi:hypothetical protein
MGRLDPAPLDAEAVAALLVGGDEQDIGSRAHVIAGVLGTIFLVFRAICLPADGLARSRWRFLRGAMVTMS